MGTTRQSLRGPNEDEIVYKAIPEESTRILSFLTGETDLMLDPPLKDVTALEEDPKVWVESCDSGDKKWFFVNITKPPFDDKKIRQAIFYALTARLSWTPSITAGPPRGRAFSHPGTMAGTPRRSVPL